MPKPVWSMGQIWRTFLRIRWMRFWVTTQKLSLPGPPHSRNLSSWKAVRDRYCAHFNEHACICFECSLVINLSLWKLFILYHIYKEPICGMGSCAENAGSNSNLKFCQNLSANANKLIMLLTHVLGLWYPQGTRLVISMKRRCLAVVAEHYWGPSF